MKKKIKLCIFIFVIIIIAIILRYILMLTNQRNVRTGIITSIDDNIITIANLRSVIGYRFPISTPVYNKNGNVIDISQMDIGDVVYINREIWLGEPQTLTHNIVAFVYEGKSDTEIMATYIRWFFSTLFFCTECPNKR